jgi:hypothetical protein
MQAEHTVVFLQARLRPHQRRAVASKWVLSYHSCGTASDSLARRATSCREGPDAVAVVLAYRFS